MKSKIIIPIIAILLVGIIIIAFIFITIPTSPPVIQSGSRKAIILGSANDFYAFEAEEDFNTGTQIDLSRARLG